MVPTCDTYSRYLLIGTRDGSYSRYLVIMISRNGILIMVPGDGTQGWHLISVPEDANLEWYLIMVPGGGTYE